MERGFLKDMSPAKQAERARKSNTPWRRQAACDTKRAQMSYARYVVRGRKEQSE